MSWNGGNVNTFASLGPIGDIYGSLNTFISSIALCAVAYTAKLQYDASKEMRKESFRNMFYTLLERNRDTIKSIILDNEEEKRSPAKYFGDLSDEFTNFFNGYILLIEKLPVDDAKKLAKKTLRELVKSKTKETSTNGFYTAFKNYKSLLNFVKNEKLLSEEEKKFYFEIIQSSMYYGEKKALLWLAVTSSNDEYKECLKNTYLLDLKIKPVDDDKLKEKEKKECIIRLAKKFNLDKSAFKSHTAFDKYDEAKKQTPT
ncbi:hypothetical protein [Acinetobacter sp. ANC 3791]|uniref:hypothetical protein n=1 Tax=Acinetobacter sp. ANC 3791 TaxID=2529836 RepID=UPI001040BE6B|nr:hypothetical protein [Acinetobacter sp. ANC 3791]TCB86320.1 hypothetical protein E0H90_00400 [Acinetobacter sp. ANC 3791]